MISALFLFINCFQGSFWWQTRDSRSVSQFSVWNWKKISWPPVCDWVEVYTALFWIAATLLKKVLFLVADTRFYTLLCWSVRLELFLIASSFCIIAPAQPSATIWPCIRPCLDRLFFLGWHMFCLVYHPCCSFLISIWSSSVLCLFMEQRQFFKEWHLFERGMLSIRNASTFWANVFLNLSKGTEYVSFQVEFTSILKTVYFILVGCLSFSWYLPFFGQWTLFYASVSAAL